MVRESHTHSMNKSGKNSIQDGAAVRAAQINLIDERIAHEFGRRAGRIKKWLKSAGAILTILGALLAVDRAALHSNVAGAIHSVLFGPRYEGSDAQTHAALSLLESLLSTAENQFCEFMEKLPYDTWSESSRSTFASLQTTRATLNAARAQFLLGPSTEQRLAESKALVARVNRLADYIDALAGYRDALLIGSQDQARKFESLWNDIKEMDENPVSKREQAIVAILKTLVLRKHVAQQPFRPKLKDAVGRLISLARDLPRDDTSGLLVVRAGNVAALLKASFTQAEFTQAEFDSRGKTLADWHYREWVEGQLAAMNMFDEIPTKARGLLEWTGVCLNNSVQRKRLLLWMAGQEEWSMKQIRDYSYPYLEEYDEHRRTLADGEEENFNSYCAFVVERFLLPDIDKAIKYWSGHSTFPVTRVEVLMLARAFSKPGEFTNKTNLEGDDKLVAKIEESLTMTRDAGYIPIDQLKADKAYRWMRDGFIFQKKPDLFDLLDLLANSLK